MPRKTLIRSASFRANIARATARVYGQLDGDFSERARWSLGLRGERHTSRYSDTTTNLDAPTTANNFGPADNLWGGQASIDYRIADGQHVYALIARGYKASGFNLSPGLPANQLQFGPESDLNLEIGHKAQLIDGRLQIDTSLFYMLRHNEQLLTGEQLDPSNPNTFIFFTGNAKSGFNYGLESTASWAATQTLGVRRLARPAADPVPGFRAKRRDLPDRACRMRLPGRPPSMQLGATRADPMRASTSPAWVRFSMICRRTGRARALMDWSTASWAGRQRAGKPIFGDATCSTRITRCAAFTSATNRRTSPTSCMCNWASPEIGACTSRSDSKDPVPLAIDAPQCALAALPSSAEFFFGSAGSSASK